MTSDQERAVAEATFYVRYAETDAMGIVHHASYLVYFEEGRSAYTRERGRSYAEMEQDGFFLAVTEVHVRYVRSARYGQQITVKTRLEEMKSRTLRFAYEIVDVDTQEMLVTGYTNHICLNQQGQVAKFPASWQVWSANP